MSKSKTENAKLGTFEIANAVAELVVEPNKKQNWQARILQMNCPWPFTFPLEEMLEEHEKTRNGKKLKKGVKRYTKRKTWDGKWRPKKFDPQESIDALYTILAFCHDDYFPENRIITDEIEAIFPGLYTTTCLYVSHMSQPDAKLRLYLKHVRQNLENNNNPPKNKQQIKTKRGRPRKYAEKNMERLKEIFDKYFKERKHKTESWQLAADKLTDEGCPIPTGTAAKAAYKRYITKKQNIKHN